MARIKTRYGYSELVSDPDDPWITRKLIAELRTEQFDEPDDEHTQVSVANEHWAVTAQVSGLITCENLDDSRARHRTCRKRCTFGTFPMSS